MQKYRRCRCWNTRLPCVREEQETFSERERGQLIQRLCDSALKENVAVRPRGKLAQQSQHNERASTSKLHKNLELCDTAVVTDRKEERHMMTQTAIVQMVSMATEMKRHQLLHREQQTQQQLLCPVASQTELYVTTDKQRRAAGGRSCGLQTNFEQVDAATQRELESSDSCTQTETQERTSANDAAKASCKNKCSKCHQNHTSSGCDVSMKNLIREANRVMENQNNILRNKTEMLSQISEMTCLTRKLAKHQYHLNNSLLQQRAAYICQKLKSKYTNSKVHTAEKGVQTSYCPSDGWELNTPDQYTNMRYTQSSMQVPNENHWGAAEGSVNSSQFQETGEQMPSLPFKQSMMQSPEQWQMPVYEQPDMRPLERQKAEMAHESIQTPWSNAMQQPNEKYMNTAPVGGQGMWNSLDNWTQKPSERVSEPHMQQAGMQPPMHWKYAQSQESMQSAWNPQKSSERVPHKSSCTQQSMGSYVEKSQVHRQSSGSPLTCWTKKSSDPIINPIMPAALDWKLKTADGNIPSPWVNPETWFLKPSEQTMASFEQSVKQQAIKRQFGTTQQYNPAEYGMHKPTQPMDVFEQVAKQPMQEELEEKVQRLVETQLEEQLEKLHLRQMVERILEKKLKNNRLYRNEFD